jgi:hypothetical protein
MLSNFLRWFVFGEPRFPVWLLPGDQINIDGSRVTYRGWPKRFPDQEALLNHFLSGRSSDLDLGACPVSHRFD